MSNSYKDTKDIHKSRYVYSDVVSAYYSYARDAKSVLEIGCGTGNNLYFFAENGCDTYGIDFNEHAVEFAKNLLKEKGLEADVRVGDVMDLPFEENKFDLILDRACLQHNRPEEVRKIMGEVERVLKPGGLFMLVNFRSSEDSAAKGLENDTTFDSYDYVNFATEEEIKEYLQNFEFEYFEHRVSHKKVPVENIHATYIIVARKK
jgi:SAM-dependent methyltransferase